MFPPGNFTVTLKRSHPQPIFYVEFMETGGSLELTVGDRTVTSNPFDGLPVAVTRGFGNAAMVAMALNEFMERRREDS